MPQRKKSEPVDLEALVERVYEQVARARGCTIASCKIPKQCKTEALSRLKARGLEVTKTKIRLPLSGQLRELLESGAFLPLTGLRSRIAGASAAEAKKAAAELVAAGEARVVVRAGKEWMVPSGSPLLPRDRLGPMAKSLDALLKLMRSAAKKRNGATLLRGDVQDLLDPVLRELAPPEPAARQESVAAVARKLLDPSVGLAFVPAVVQALARTSNRDAAKDAVLQAAKRGEVELRPESGMGRLTDEERAACLPGSDGTLLSWIRVREDRA